MDEREPRSERQREPRTEREEHLPEHELRDETGVGAGVDPAGTAEEAGQVGSPGGGWDHEPVEGADEEEPAADPDVIPPITRSG